MKTKKICTALLAAALGFGFMAGPPVSEAATRAELAKISVNRSGGNFKYWNKDAQSYRALTAYIKDVTDKNSKNFIPVADRIAVFDLDGTLVGETMPCYFEWMLYLERALHDPSYTASPEDRATAEMVEDGIYHIGIPNPVPEPNVFDRPTAQHSLTEIPKDNMIREAKSQLSVFADMTLPEYEAYVRKFMETSPEGMVNLKWGEAFYLPMVEVISYLNANQFKVFIVSGTDRQTLRVLVNGVLPVESDNIIGTDASHPALHQGDTDGVNYLYTKDDKVLRGEFVMKDLKMNKVSNIVREIGKQPVLAFGNSSGDFSMFNYTITNNKYKSLAFALLCDDTAREYGSPKKAEKLRKTCEESGWIPVSMRDDFKTIYGDNVTRADK